MTASRALRVPPLLAAGLAGLLLLALAPRDATACSLPPFEPFEGEADGERPGGIAVTVKVSRGDFFCPGEPQHSCGDLASVQLLLRPVEGTTLAPAIRVALGQGAPMTLPTDGPLLLRADDSGTANFGLHWGDGSTFEQEPLDFTVTVTPFDGDDGPATVVRVQDPGRSGAEPCVVDAIDAGSLPPLSGNDPEEEPEAPAGCSCGGSLALAPFVGLLRRRRAGRTPD